MSDVVVIAEHRRGELRAVTDELLACGSDLADALDGELHVGVIGEGVESFVDQLDRAGVDAIWTVPVGPTFNHDIYRRATGELVETVDPLVVVTPHSVNGMDYAPAVATDLDAALLTDAIGIDADDGSLEIVREMYGSKVETTIQVQDDRYVVTIRSGEWSGIDTAGDARLETLEIDLDPADSGARVLDFDEPAVGDVDITEADVLVSIGRGIDEEENLDIIHELADALDATVAASRPIVDAGWLPKNRQVGQSGKTVTPTVYIAIGISGAVQHVAGMKGAETIIAINNDPNAPIFDIADYGIVDDLFDVVPALTDVLS